MSHFRTVQQYADYELALRGRFLRLVLQGTAVLVLLYLLLGLLPLFNPLLYPWDGVGMGLLCVVCGWLAWRNTEKSVPLAASWLVAGVNILATFNMQFYGVRHPVVALFLLGLILAGMLIGGWFLRVWVGMDAFFLLLWSYLELTNAASETVLAPLTSWVDLGQTVLPWLVAFVLTGWLVWLFARTLEQATQVARGQTGALATLTQRLSSSAEINDISTQALATIAEQMSASWATLFVHDPETDLLQVQAAFGAGKALTMAEIRKISPPPTAATGLRLWEKMEREKRPFVISDIENDNLLKNKSQIIEQGIQTILFVPLLNGQLLGYFSLNSLEPRRFSADELALAEAFVQQVTLAMRLNLLTERERETAVLEERNRFARDIHDTLAQGFTGIVIQLEAAEDNLEDGETIQLQAHLARARELARQSLQEARRSVQALRPQVLEELPLPDALRQMVQKMTPGTLVRGQVNVLGDLVSLPEQSEAELLRIAQEAVTNALKHAKPSAINVELAYLPEMIRLVIQDNGRGFDPAQPAAGFGLTGMRERAMRIGAQLTVKMRPEGGSEVVCLVKRPFY